MANKDDFRTNPSRTTLGIWQRKFKGNIL